MSAKRWKAASVAVAAAAVASTGRAQAEKATVEELIAKIKDKDNKVRGEAWQNAGKAGAAAVKALAAVMTDKEFEIARAAKNGLWKIVRHVGRPGADQERKAVVAELLPLLGDSQAVSVRREALWMLSELGEDETVEPVAALLKNEELREDARMVLQRLPGAKSLAVLKAGLAASPEEFKPNIAQSLRARGVDVAGIPNRKMVPTRKTNLTPRG